MAGRDCGCCGGDVGPSMTFPWHYRDEDCRASRKPISVDELRAVLGPNWAICRPTERNRERYARCITERQYQAAIREAARRREASCES